MKVIDLTQIMTNDTPVFPGTEKPKLESVFTLERDGAVVTLLTMHSHTGTHMDAPSHMVAGKPMLDQMPVSNFVGKALVIDASDCKAGDKITMAYINKVKDKADQAEIILFRTDWDKKWETEDEYLGEYPCIDGDVVQYIIDSKKKCVGFDVIGADALADEAYTNHLKLFNSTGAVIVENLTNLSQCGSDLFLFCALPLKYKDADGSPIRAIGILE